MSNDDVSRDTRLRMLDACRKGLKDALTFSGEVVFSPADDGGTSMRVAYTARTTKGRMWLFGVAIVPISVEIPGVEAAETALAIRYTREELELLPATELRQLVRSPGRKTKTTLIEEILRTLDRA